MCCPRVERPPYDGTHVGGCTSPWLALNRGGYGDCVEPRLFVRRLTGSALLGADLDEWYTAQSLGRRPPLGLLQSLGQDAWAPMVGAPRPSRRSRPAGRDTS